MILFEVYEQKIETFHFLSDSMFYFRFTLVISYYEKHKTMAPMKKSKIYRLKYVLTNDYISLRLAASHFS